MSNREEIVTKLTFDNDQFERGIKESIKSLDDLSRSLKLDKAAEGLINLERQASNFSLHNVSSAVTQGIRDFGALGVAGVTAIQDITHSAIASAKQITRDFVKPITSGFQEYETQINSVQTILTNTKSKGTTIDQVNAALDELNLYADKTIYSFTQMTENIGRFTASGVGLEDSVAAIKGISNLAAASGSNMDQAGRAMYNLSQALSSGTLKLIDWNSVVNAGMGGEIFQESLKETARVHGIAVDDMIAKEGSFKDSLKEGWITSEVLLETLQKFTGDLTDDQLRSLGYTDDQIRGIQELAGDADKAATQVKSFTQLKDTMFESMQSGWTQTWQLILGDLNQAREFWTGISDILNSVISKASNARNDFVAAIMGDPADQKVAYEDWLKFAKSGNLTEQIKQALIIEAKKSGVDIENILAKYGAYGSDAFTASIREEGWLTESMIRNVREKARDVGYLAESYGEAVHSYSELAQVVRDVEEGVYRNSDTGRYDLLREAGWDPELVQRLVDLDLAGVAIDWENLNDEQLRNLGISDEIISRFNGMSQSYGEAIHSYSDLAQVVKDVEDGLYRNSDTGRYDLLREAGWDPELVQELVNLDLAGVYIDWENLNDEQLRNLGISEEVIARFHEMNEEYAIQIDNVESLDALLDENSGLSGRDLLLGGITNIVQAATDAVDLFGQVWNEVFPPEGPEGVRLLLESFKEFTDSIQIFTRITDDEGNVIDVKLTDFGEKIKAIFTGIADAIGIVADIIGGVIDVIGSFLSASGIENFDLLQVFVDIATAISQFRDAMQSGELFSGFTESFTPVFEKIKGIIGTIGAIVGDFFSGKGLNTELLEKLQQDIPSAFEEVSKFAKDTLKNVWSSIKEFLKGKGIDFEWFEKLKKKIKSFDIVAFIKDALFGGGIATAIKNIFGDIDIGAEIQKAWGSFTSWFGSLDLVNDPVGTISAVWDGFVEWFNGLGIEFDPEQALQDAWNAFVSWFEGLDLTFDPEEIVTKAWNAFVTWWDSLGIEFDITGPIVQGWTSFKTWFEGLQLKFDPQLVLDVAWNEFVKFMSGQQLVFNPQGTTAGQAWEDFKSWFEGLNVTFDANGDLDTEWEKLRSWFEGLLLTFDPSGNLSRAFQDFSNFIGQFETLFSFGEESPLYQSWIALKSWFEGLDISFDPSGLLSGFFQDFSNFIGQFETLFSFGEGNPLYQGWIAIKSWFEGLSLSFDPNGLLSSAVQALGDWFGTISVPDLSEFDPAKKWEEFTTWFGGLGDTLIFDENSLLAQAIRDMQDFFSNIKIDTTALSNVGGIVEGLATGFGSLIDSIFGVKKAYAHEAEDVTSDMDDVTEASEGLVQSVEDSSGAFDSGNNIFSQISEAANSAFQSLTSEGSFEAGLQLLERLPAALEAIGIAYMTYKIGSLIGDIGNAITALSDNIGTTVTSVGNELGKAIAGSDAGKVKQITAENQADVIRAKTDMIWKSVLSIAAAVAILVAAINYASQIEDPEAAVEPILLAVGAIGLVLGAFALLFSGTGGSQTIGGVTVTAPKTDPSKLKLPDASIFIGIAAALWMMVALIDKVKEIELSPMDFLKVVSLIGSLSIILGITAGLASFGGGGGNIGAAAAAIIAVPVAINMLLDTVKSIKDSGIKKEDIQDALDIVTELGLILSGGLALANLGNTVSGIGTGVASLFGAFGKKAPGATTATQNKTAMQNVTQAVDMAAIIAAYVAAIKDLLDSVKSLSDYMANEDGTTNEAIVERLDKASGLIVTISLAFDALAAVTTAGGRLGGALGIIGMLAGSGSMWIATQAIVQVIESAKSIAETDVEPEKLDRVRWLIEAIGGVFTAISGIGALAGGLGGAGGVFGTLFGSGGSWVVGDAIVKILSTVEEMSSQSYSDHKIDKVTGLIVAIGGMFTAIELTTGIVGGAGEGWSSLGMAVGSGGSWVVGDAIVKILSSVEEMSSDSYSDHKIDKVTGLIIALGGMFDSIQLISGLAGGIGKGWGSLGMLVGSGGSWAIGDAIVRIFESLDAFKDLDEGEIANIQEIIKQIGILFGALETVFGVVGGVGNIFGSLGMFVGSTGADAVAGAIVKIVEALKELSTLDNAALETAVNNMNYLFESIDARALGVASGNYAIGFIEGVVAGIGDWIGSLGEAIAEFGGEIGDALWKAVVDFINGAANSMGLPDVIHIPEADVEPERVNFTVRGTEYTAEMAAGTKKSVVMNGEDGNFSIGLVVGENGEVTVLDPENLRIEDPTYDLQTDLENYGDYAWYAGDLNIKMKVPSIGLDSSGGVEVTDESLDELDTEIEKEVSGHLESTSSTRVVPANVTVDISTEVGNNLEGRVVDIEGTEYYVEAPKGSIAHIKVSDVDYYYDFSNSSSKPMSDQLVELNKDNIIDVDVQLAEDALAELQAQATDAGEDVGEDVVAGSENAINETSIDASGFGDNVEAGMREAVDSNSPAKRMIPVGEDIVAGVALGINQGGSYLINAFKNMMSASVIYLSQLTSKFQQSGLDSTSSIAWGINQGGSYLITAYDNMVSASIIYLSQLASRFQQPGLDATSNIAWGINQGGSYLITAYDNMVSASIVYLAQLAPKFQQPGLDVTSNIATGINQGGSYLITAYDNMVSASITYLSQLTPKFQPSGLDIVSNIAWGVNQGGSYLITAYDNMVSASVIYLSQLASKFQPFGSDVTSNIAWGINLGGSVINTALNNMNDAMITVLDNKKSEFETAGYNLASGLADGIDNGASLAVNAAIRLATDSLTSAKKALDERSPSKKSMQIGEFFSQGMGIGIRNAARFVTDQVDILGNDLVGSIRTTAQLVDTVMNDELDMNPTITPVIDMSNLQNANDLMDGLFGSRSVSLAYRARQAGENAITTADRISELMNNREPAIGPTNNIYIDGARVNDDAAIHDGMLNMLYGLKRKAVL